MSCNKKCDESSEMAKAGQNEQLNVANAGEGSEPEKSEPEDNEDDEETGFVTVSEEDKEAYELDFQHCKIRKIENLESLTRIETLGFRWNFLKKIENLDHLTTLQELELYDNQISKIENLDGLVNLRMLDLSHNRLRFFSFLIFLNNVYF